jgi:hypothetical protein
MFRQQLPDAAKNSLRSCPCRLSKTTDIPEAKASCASNCFPNSFFFCDSILTYGFFHVKC